MLRLLSVLLLCAASAHAELIATFTREGKTDTRRDRFPALSIQKGEPPTPFLAPGPFDAVWTGKLVLGKRQRLAFSFEGEGSVTLKVDGVELFKREGVLAGPPSETKRLNPGEHDFELTYKSKADGSAAMRIYWEEAGFVRQTIPATAFLAQETEASKIGDLQRAGRLHFAQQNCSKCHVPEKGFSAAPMPEIADFGPLLYNIGDKASEDWLRRWLADPKKLRPTTHMPTLVDATTEEGRQQAADMAAFLATMKMGDPASPDPSAELSEKGGVQFHELGCVACHNMPNKNGDELDKSRVPLNDVASKFVPGALVAYLKKPDANHSSAMMPDFKMSDEEASAIAAYLLKASAGKETKYEQEFPKGDPTRGQKVVADLQCGVCHPGLMMSPNQAVPLDALFKKDWAVAGCVAPADKRGKAPVLNLTDSAKAAVVEFGKCGMEPLNQDTASEFATRRMQSQSCFGCHNVDDKQSRLNTTHEESMSLTGGSKGLHERVDQTRPHLTFIGEMLYTTYIEAMLTGTESERPRPWLGTRMPAFRSHSKQMAEGLSKLHGFEPSGPAEVKLDPAMVEIGGKLVGMDAFGCTTCHGIGDVKPSAAFEVEGINFSLVPERLREGYYHRWMDNPKLVTPNTKMPKYAEGNVSQRADFLGGDAEKQYEAIWEFIHSK